MLLFTVGQQTDVAIADSETALVRARNDWTDKVRVFPPVDVATIIASIDRDPTQRIVFIAHGQETALLDGAMPRAAFLSEDHASNFQGKYVFAHACLTGRSLGKTFVKYAFLFIGFDTLISAPPVSHGPFFDVLLEIYNIFLQFLGNAESAEAGGVKADAVAFLATLKAKIDATELAFTTVEKSLLPLEELICLLQFRNSTCVWVRGEEQVIKCIGCPSRPDVW